MKLATVVLAAMAAAGSGAMGLEKRIVGGSAVSDSAAAGQYAFVTNIIVNGRDGAAACTGALISSTVVLTSASCVADPVSNKPLVVSRIAVGRGNLAALLGGSSGGGDADLSKAEAAGYVSPQSIAVHPGYDSVAHSDNIAVLTLPRALANSTGDGAVAKLITKPSTAAKAAYTAVGWGTTSASDASAYPSHLQRVQLTVGANSTCTDIWAPYASLTNTLCLVPAKSSANVCSGDGLLVKQASDKKSVGLAGILNMVAAKKDVPAEKCTEDGVADFFTTFGNYLGWLTQVTPLNETDFVATASFSYNTPDPADDGSSKSAGDDEDDGGKLDSASDSGVAGRRISVLAALAAAAAAAGGAML
ncbi:hypothetical protein H4R18_004330 [Coemansia javaensis]|uniref:Peptidase S1 domain-containing protein n=1 Tax=Coemansia javaensis TaxID=2761396 RepID=A0A9W8H817_9FUNG|nr:hypothetical protein H4R18_004330 [Coemansia javaensis]